MLCKSCSSTIDDKSRFCMYCGHAVEDNKSWNMTICHDDSLWNRDAFEEYPSIIAHEYHRIYELMLDNKTYGAMMQIKDFIEILVKVPVVIEMARIGEKEDKNENDYSFINKLLAKPLSLGDWREGISKMSKHNEHIFDKRFIDDLKDLYNKKDIFGKEPVDLVHWRNRCLSSKLS